MSEHAQLKAEKREMLGKKVRRLRREGKLPATVYGHNIQPQSIQVDAKDMRHALRTAGRTQLIDLAIDGERTRPVFVKQTAVDAKRNTLLHIEFYQANLKEKMTTRVPIHFTGDSPAVKAGGILLTVLDHVDVECLPDNVPQGFELDLSDLVEINAVSHVSDLAVPSGVMILTPADDLLAKIDPPVSEEALEATLAEPTELPAEPGGDETPADAVPEE